MAGGEGASALPAGPATVSSAALAFAAPTGGPRWKRWLLYSAVARIVIFATMAAGSMFVAAELLAHAAPALDLSSDADTLLRFAIQAGCTLAAYLFLVRVIERRRPLELLPPSGGLAALAAGTAIGTGLMSLSVMLLWLAGSYRVTGTNPNVDWWVPLLTIGLAAAISEEIAFRGVLFRVVEEAAGTWWALIVSALFFGAVHLGNPGATLWNSAAIAIEAGLTLGLAYHLTRSLPLCIGIHMGWNFAQGTVFGIPVSGTAAKGWLVAERPGPDWLTGGAFGAEASMLALAICSLLTATLLAHAWRRQTLVPMRRHKPMMEAATPAQDPC
jgi:uncharacterized protein